jgi:uncharacterized protein YndB with AHSA1/START domain
MPAARFVIDVPQTSTADDGTARRSCKWTEANMTTKTIENAKTTAEVETTIHAAKSRVWHALTDPSAIRQYYLGATVRTDWSVGGPITGSGEWNGKRYEDKGEILAFEPERELRFSHWSPKAGSTQKPENFHIVTIALRDAGKDTRVTLTQSNASGQVTDADREHRADFEKNWSTMLEGLKRVVERSKQ